MFNVYHICQSNWVITARSDRNEWNWALYELRSIDWCSKVLGQFIVLLTILLLEFFIQKVHPMDILHFTIQSVHCFSIQCTNLFGMPLNYYYCHGNERWPMPNTQSVQSPHISLISRCFIIINQIWWLNLLP